MTRAGIVRISVIVATICLFASVAISAVTGHAGPGLYLTAAAATSTVIFARLALGGRRH